MRPADDGTDPTPAEIVAASACALIATAVVAAYLVYRSGLRVAPLGVLFASSIVPVAIVIRLRRRLTWCGGEVTAFVAIFVVVFTWIVWQSRPSLLPVGGGADLTPHMVLIGYIEEHWQLVTDPSLVPYLGDMIHYTPGSHLLMALAGAWLRTDALHVVHSVLALTVALKAGFVFLVTLRLLPRDVPRIPIAIASVLLLFLPLEYFLGSFMRDSFWAQVVAELFACAMWAGLTVWDARPSPWTMALVGLAGAATFVTWPVWVGPPAVALCALVAFHDDLPWRARLSHVTAGLVPIAAVAVVHLAGRLEWLRMAAASGAVVRPSPLVFGWTLLALAAIGLLLTARRREGRATALLVAAIALQTVALFVHATARGADTPYLAYKMMYLLIYPLAAVSALAIAEAWRFWDRAVGTPFARASAVAWLLLACAGAVTARHVRLTAPSSPIVSESVYAAGRWARVNLGAACVDYLVTDGYTGYWLHLAVLGNPWPTARMQDPETFEPKKALVRWLYPGGLPFAIVDDMRALPRDLRESVDVLAVFGPSAVVKRRGRASCPG